MSEPIEIKLNPSKQLLRLNCGQCGDSKDIIIEIDEPDISEIRRRNIETEIEGILIEFASKVGTEDARSSRVTADNILENVIRRLCATPINKVNVVIQDSIDFAKEDSPDSFLSPVEIIV